MLGAVALPDIPTGNSLIVRPNTLPAQTGGGGTTSMSPGQSAVAMFADMRDSLETIVLNTGKTVELLKTAVLGTPDQQRREKIERAETDTDIPPTEDDIDKGGPGFLSKLNKLNPFSSESGAAIKFIAAGLGLIGLNVFKDKLIPKLSALLEFFFGEGKEGSFSSIMDSILEKVKKIVEDLKERIQPIIDDLKLKFEVMKVRVETFLKNVEGIVTILSDVIKKIEDYVDSFDVDGIEGLSKEEKDALIADIQTKIKDGLYNLFGDLIGGAKGILGLLTVASIMSRIKTAVPVVRAGAPFAARFAALGGIGVGGVAGLGLLAAAGIYTAYEKVFDSINQALDEETGKTDKSEALSNMLGGTLNKEGGVMNALDNSFKFGLMGATLGLFLGGPPGAIAGFKIGSVLGGFLGYIGSENIDKVLDKPIDQEISTAVKTITKPKKEDTDAENIQNRLDEKLIEKDKIIAKHGKHSTNVSRIDREIRILEDKLKNVDAAKVHFEEVELFNMQTERGHSLMAIESIKGNLRAHEQQIRLGGGPLYSDEDIADMKNMINEHALDAQMYDEFIKEQKALLIKLNPKSSIMREKMIPAGPVGKPVLTMVPDYTPGITYVDGKRVDASQDIYKHDQTFVTDDLGAGINDAELAAAVTASKG